MSLRMEAGLYAYLAALARAEGHSVSEEIRLAIDRYCAARKADLGFRERALRLADEYEQRAAELRAMGEQRG